MRRRGSIRPPGATVGLVVDESRLACTVYPVGRVWAGERQGADAAGWSQRMSGSRRRDGLADRPPAKSNMVGKRGGSSSWFTHEVRDPWCVAGL